MNLENANSLDGRFSKWRERLKKKRAVKSVVQAASKKEVTTKKPVSAERIVEGFTAHYGYPVELIDNPEAWESENFYFGETPTLYMGATAPAKEPSWFEKYIVPVVQTSVALKQQKQALKLAQQENVTRAQQGLPPLSTTEIKRQFAPQAGVEVSLSPQIRNMLLFGGLGVGAFLVINMMRKKAG
jgi:hypothetical protein